MKCAGYWLHLQTNDSDQRGILRITVGSVVERKIHRHKTAKPLRVGCNDRLGLS